MRQAKFTKLLTIAISPQLFSKVKEITDKERISMAEWFRKAAQEALSRYQMGEDK